MPSYRRELSALNKEEWAEARALREELRRAANRREKQADETIVLPPDDYARAKQLSDLPWSKSSNVPRPPAWTVPSQTIFCELIEHGGRLAASAKALGVSPQTLRRRLMFDTELARVWSEVANEFHKPNALKTKTGPKHLRLCSVAELHNYQKYLAFVSR